MLSLISVPSAPAMPPMDDRATRRVDRLKHEMLTLTIGCVAAAVIAMGMCLAAPTTLRDDVISAFLGFDQPMSSIPVAKPMRL
jgi:hypothetical protein